MRTMRQENPVPSGGRGFSAFSGHLTKRRQQFLVDRHEFLDQFPQPVVRRGYSPDSCSPRARLSRAHGYFS